MEEAKQININSSVMFTIWGIKTRKLKSQKTSNIFIYHLNLR